MYAHIVEEIRLGYRGTRLFQKQIFAERQIFGKL
jgi:hypothetical protein